MANNRFNIKGTKDFLVAAVFCACVCIWAVMDGWFPAKRVLKKHPHEIEVSFKVPGVLKHVNVKPGDKVGGTAPLAVLYDDSYRKKIAEAEAAVAAAKASGDSPSEDKLAAVTQAKADLESCTLKASDFTWKSTHGEEALRGTVCRLTAGVSEHVEAGSPVMTVKPDDSFYIFNQSLAVLMFIGLIASLIFHRIASR
jgi:multidrug resistance efflux pump